MRKLVSLVIVALIIVISGFTCYAERGQLLSEKLYKNKLFTATDYAACLEMSVFSAEMRAWAKSELGSSKNSVRAYQIAYTSINHNEQELAVSGVVLVPDTNQVVLPVVVFQRATIISNAFSVFEIEKSAQALAFLASFAARGYVVAISDYVGTGAYYNDDEEYLYAPTEAANGVDVIKATDDLLAKLNKQRGNLYVCGYSQGGQAASALARDIQANYPQYPIKAACLMEGPYDMHATMENILRPSGVSYGMVPIGTLIAAKALYSYNKIYKWGSLEQLFVAPYAKRVRKDFSVAQPSLLRMVFLYPNDTRKLFRPTTLQSALSGQLAQDIAQNNTDDWVPKMPVYIMTSRVDTLIPAAIAENTYAKMLARGGNVFLHYSPFAVDHLQNFLPSVVHAYNIFNIYETLN